MTLTAYHAALLIKFIGVALFTGGMGANLVATGMHERKVAVHRIASPGLLLTWLGGAGAAEMTAIPLTEAWTLGGVFFSFLSMSALVISVSREKKSLGMTLFAVMPLFVVLILMIARPTWAGLRS